MSGGGLNIIAPTTDRFRFYVANSYDLRLVLISIARPRAGALAGACCFLQDREECRLRLAFAIEEQGKLVRPRVGKLLSHDPPSVTPHKVTRPIEL